MSKTEESIDVNVPVETAYNQWTQFETFPEFMEGVIEVRQLGPTELFWRAEVAGKEKEWNARITEQTPDQRIAWVSTEGASNGGVVTFHKLEGPWTRIMLQLEFEPEGVVEKAGDSAGLVRSRVKKALQRFKEFIERRGTETGAWRGEVERTGARTARTA